MEYTTPSLLILFGYLCGSIPFSLLVGYLGGAGDIRRVGDHNPGATNVLHSAGWRWALPALLLDFFKGALPVGISWFFIGLHGWQLVVAALAPVAGHIWSPWLRFRGGKAVATTFGIWGGLTIGAGPTILGLFLGIGYALLSSSAWSVLLAFLGFGSFLLLEYTRSSPLFIWIWIGNMILLVWTHRHEFGTPPRLRPELIARVQKLRRN